MAQETILVTGGTGFLGSWVCLLALQAGYQVRTTVRSLQKADTVRQMMIDGGATKEQADSINFFEADLSSDAGWTEACAGATYVHHVASPFPAAAPKHEDDLIIPAREGTLRALRAAKASGTVKRVIVTSSIAAVAYGHVYDKDKVFTEADWSNLNGKPIPPYQKSKTIAERAAWDWIAKEGNGLELATVNPGGICGPVLGKSAGTSVDVAVKMLNGSVPFVPKIYGAWVDVRDVADLHMRAMTDPRAAGERFIAVESGAWVKDIGQWLKDGLGPKASKVGTREIPNFVIKLAALFDSTAAFAKSELDDPKVCSGEKAQKMLGWHPRPLKESIIATGESVIEYGLV